MLITRQIKPYRNFAKPYYAAKDSAHDFRHIERIIDRLGMLLEDISQPIDSEKLCFLACFHGLGKQLSSDEEFKQQVRTFLEAIGWNTEDVEEVFQGLHRHLSHPQSIEEQIVHDANYVETLGAFGIAKAFTTGGARGQSLEETSDIFEHQYLDRVIFQTPAGKRLAAERRSYAREFLARLRNEL